MFTCIGFRFWRFNNGDLSSGLCTLIRFDSDELTLMWVFDVFDEIAVKHEGSFEDADHHQIDVSLFTLNLVVVLVDLFS